MIPQAEAWNAAHWAETTMGAELVAIYTTLANKAPGGYGLGNPQGLTDADDINARHGNGCYSWGRIVPKNVPPLLRTERNYMYMLEFGDSAGFTQIMGCYIETNPGLICRQAFAKSGGVQFAEWEWVNPRMELGTEYRTTERYLGKPVYCTLIDCGAVPDVNTNKTIGFSCPGISRIISWTGNVDIGGNTFALPYHEIGRKVNNASIYVFVNYTGITLRTDDQWFAANGGTAQCTIWYTKTAD